MQQFCNSCDEYRDVVIDSDCTSCVWHKAVADTEERIIKLLLDNYQERLSDGSRVPSNHNDSLDETIALIKDPTRNIRSEILPEGSIYIEEIKGEK